MGCSCKLILIRQDGRSDVAQLQCVSSTLKRNDRKRTKRLYIQETSIKASTSIHYRATLSAAAQLVEAAGISYKFPNHFHSFTPHTTFHHHRPLHIVARSNAAKANPVEAG
jgi:hypothetical protein